MITFIKLLFKTIVDNKDISLVIETKLLKKKPQITKVYQWENEEYVDKFKERAWIIERRECT